MSRYEEYTFIYRDFSNRGFEPLSEYPTVLEHDLAQRLDETLENHESMSFEDIDGAPEWYVWGMELLGQEQAYRFTVRREVV